MFEFVNRVRTKKQQQAATDIQKYSALIRLGARSGKLSNADQLELEQLADRLGKSVEEIEADVATITEANALEQQVAGMDAAKKMYMDAKQTLRDFHQKNDVQALQRELEQKIRDIDSGIAKLRLAETAANERMDELCKASTHLSELRHASWKLLGLPEQPAIEAVEFSPIHDKIRRKDWKKQALSEMGIAEPEPQPVEVFEDAARPAI